MYKKGFGHIIAIILGFIIIAMLIGVFTTPNHVNAPQIQNSIL